MQESPFRFAGFSVKKAPGALGLGLRRSVLPILQAVAKPCCIHGALGLHHIFPQFGSGKTGNPWLDSLPQLFEGGHRRPENVINNKQECPSEDSVEVGGKSACAHRFDGSFN